MLNISIFSQAKSVKCPIDCLYIHAVYVSFRPKTMTPQCICPSLESCLLKSTCVVLNTLYFLLQPTICMPLYLSMAIYHDTTMHMSFARVLNTLFFLLQPRICMPHISQWQSTGIIDKYFFGKYCFEQQNTFHKNKRIQHAI